MRTADQVKRKLNELVSQKKSLKIKLDQAEADIEHGPLKQQIIRLDEQILLLEWIINEPTGSYHV
ncbi:hypothetical protein [Paenibacillus abyssi]|uniref:Uncharacterized protein n=1 Tax=Paenibacillus abyssi TaxID=1340531 RepID=A0A917D5L3_9BACL|nr:hypothetical protein [Paenibacillus abyssi]GGG09677.1 hypothetical protein GCM10010916_28210 [Paenibacillus abyssi]